MGISRFMTLVRKLTSQSCFLFCSYNVNGAPSCPSCNHPSPTNCTDSGLDSLSFFLSLTFSFSCLSPAAFIYSLPLSVSLSLSTAPPCLVRGQIYLSCQTGETYTLSLPHMGKGIFSQRKNWHAIIMFSLFQTSFTKYIASCFWLTWVYDLVHGTIVLLVYCGCFLLCLLMVYLFNWAKAF